MQRCTALSERNVDYCNAEFILLKHRFLCCRSIPYQNTVNQTDCSQVEASVLWSPDAVLPPQLPYDNVVDDENDRPAEKINLRENIVHIAERKRSSSSIAIDTTPEKRNRLADARANYQAESID